MALHVPKAPGFASMMKEGARHYSGLEEAVIRFLYAAITCAALLIHKKEEICTLALNITHVYVTPPYTPPLLLLSCDKLILSFILRRIYPSTRSSLFLVNRKELILFQIVLYNQATRQKREIQKMNSHNKGR